jgi:hypothetical protein
MRGAAANFMRRNDTILHPDLNIHKQTPRFRIARRFVALKGCAAMHFKQTTVRIQYSGGVATADASRLGRGSQTSKVAVPT